LAQLPMSESAFPCARVLRVREKKPPQVEEGGAHSIPFFSGKRGGNGEKNRPDHSRLGWRRMQEYRPLLSKRPAFRTRKRSLVSCFLLSEATRSRKGESLARSLPLSWGFWGGR
jgi:hypothetical protein